MNQRPPVSLATPTSMIQTLPKMLPPMIPAIPGQNVMFCYNPMLLPGMPMMIPPGMPRMMAPMMMRMPMPNVPMPLPPQMQPIVSESETSSPLDLTKKPTASEEVKRVKLEPKDLLNSNFQTSDSSRSPIGKYDIDVESKTDDEKAEDLSKPCYKKNMLKRYRGKCLGFPLVL